jgi:membrane fusion protein (multidrug efflux system)
MLVASVRFLMFCTLNLVALSTFAQVPSKVVDVIVQAVDERQLQTTIEALGTLRANESIRVTSNVTNTVTRINFEDGQRVKSGDVLVEMMNAEERALVEEARINSLEAKQQLERVRTLVTSNAASKSMLDQKVREYESAKAREAALDAKLKELRLVAPFDGMVGLRNISVGALVSPGDLITTLNDDHRMKLDFTVPAIFLRSLRVGLPVRAVSHALGNKEFAGELFSIDNQIDPVTRAISVRAILPNEQRELRQGMLMTVELFSDQRDALVVPESALVPLGSNNYVFLIQHTDAATKVERREIKIGQRLQGFVEVLTGVERGDKVVIHGLQKVRDGQPVKVIAEKSAGDSLSDLLSRKKS